ncbi:MAG TPA: hypothetical protein HA360_02295 [Nanoarchaeota archaeon]|nr:hypothetical protein [Candidatus Woesearchaeota archaeon]HIH15016.1 hypothetical protein [Nanoarchaeota archaeon]HIH59372.1 hypothetical protein [Nanoarchaeota archaeon]HII13882.1 hypothetical protein [Nanoarchaeota archaeon]HIJ04640.1 hypothetical protein [Nanoarchaeota archaeon]
MQKALLELEEQVKGSVTWVIKWLAYDWDLPQPETPNIIIIASPNYKELKKRGIEGATYLTEARGDIPAETIILPISKETTECILEETSHFFIGKYIPKRRAQQYSTNLSMHILQEAGAELIKRIYGLNRNIDTKLPENILGAKDLTGKALFEEFLEGNIDEFYKNIYFCNDVSTAKELYCKMIGFVKRTEFSQLFAHHIGDRLGQRLHQSLEAQTIQKQELKEAIFTKEYPLRQRLEKLRRLAKRN